LEVAFVLSVDTMNCYKFEFSGNFADLGGNSS